MVEKVVIPGPNVVDLSRYQQGRNSTGKMRALPVRICRHCKAALLEGENEDDCSSAATLRRFYAD
jgi:hypothetical protein